MSLEQHEEYKRKKRVVAYTLPQHEVLRTAKRENGVTTRLAVQEGIYDQGQTFRRGARQLVEDELLRKHDHPQRNADIYRITDRGCRMLDLLTDILYN